MNQELKYIAVIPSYEPDGNLLKIVNELKEKNFIVIVINDGSDISYDDYYNGCNTKIISYPVNRGKGYALKKGFEYVKNNYDNYIIATVDGDGQHKADDVINLCKYVENNPDTLAIGKRIIRDNVPIRSAIGNTITRYIFNLATGEKIYDTQSGLRAFSYKLIDYMLENEGHRYEYEMNVLLYLKKKNIKYKEIEIRTIYIDDNKKSHFKTISDSFKIYGKIAEFKVKTLIPFLTELLIFAALMISIYKIIQSNIISKTLSIVIYYILNKEDIFKDKINIKNIFLQLLTIILYIFISTVLIYLMSKLINPYISKVITEILIFILINKIENKFHLIDKIEKRFIIK